MRRWQKESNVALGTMAKLYDAVARNIEIDGRFREIRAYVKEANEVVRGEKERRNLEALFRWFCRLLLASMDVANLKREPGWTSESIIAKMRPSFESVLPKVETLYLYLGFVRAMHVRSAHGQKAHTRLVAYALFSEMGAPKPVVHVVRWNVGSKTGETGLIVYAECIDGEWEIHYTPLLPATVPGAGAPVPVLQFDTVTIIKWRGQTRQNGKVALSIYSIESRRKSDAGNARVWAALSLLGRLVPISVPTPVSIESGTPVLLNEHDQAQLEVYRRIAKHFRFPFPRYGRTLLSILRTWGVVGDEVSVDRALLDVLYKYEGAECVALEFEELEQYVNEALEAKRVYDGAAFDKVKSVTCTGDKVLVKRKGRALNIKKEKINNELSTNGVPDVLFARPAAEFAAIMGAGTRNPVSVDFTKVREWDEGSQQPNPVVDDASRLLPYWGLVYRMLAVQTDNAKECLKKYKEWYEKAFESTEPVYIAWDRPNVQSVATIPLMSYVTMRVQRGRSFVGTRPYTWRVYRRKSTTAFDAGKLVEGTLVWHRTEHIDSIRKRNRDVYGPYFSEKEVRQFAESTDEPLRILRDHERRGDSFVLKCQIRPITMADTASYDVVLAFIAAQVPFERVKWAYLKVVNGSKLETTGAVVGGIGAVAATSLFAGASSWSAIATTGIVAVGSGVTGAAVGAGLFIGVAGFASKIGSWVWGKLSRSALDYKRRAEGGEEPSAETPVKEEVFDLAAFFVDTTASACEVVRQNAYLAAQAYEQT
jgi:hypothetical protein